jgi:hypothetical protein
MRRYWILAGVFLALPVAAAEDLSAAIAACRAEQDAAARLECYDRQADRLNERAASAAAAPVTPAAAATPGAEAAVAGATVAAAATSASPAASAPAAQSAATGTAAAKAVTPEEQFGYGAGAMARADTDQKKEEAAKTALNEIVATVTQVSTRQRGEFVVTLDNGQVWAQKAPESNVRVKVGDQVRIKSGALNSYMLSLTRSDRTTRVTRVR